MFELLFEFLFNLPLAQAILFNLGIILINILFSFLLKTLVERKYKKTNSVEETLYFQQILGKYLQFILILFTSFFSALSLSPHLVWMGGLQLLGLLIIVYCYLFIILIFNQLILHDLNASLRKTTSSKWDQTKLLLRGLIFTALPIIILLVLIDINPLKNFGGERLQKYIKILFPMAIYLLLSFIMPLFNKYLLKAKDFHEGELKNDLTSFLEKAGIKKFKLYLWLTKDNKHANALVSGLLTKQIFLSDYLLENFTEEETKSVLAHEIGHIKKHHLWIRTGLVLGLFILGPALGTLMDLYEDIFNEISLWVGIGIIALFLITYLVFLRFLTSRIQERQADAFVLEMGIEPEVFASALEKLAKLNHSVKKFNKVDEKFQTHPSIDRRIKWILEKNKM